MHRVSMQIILPTDSVNECDMLSHCSEDSTLLHTQVEVKVEGVGGGQTGDILS